MGDRVGNRVGNRPVGSRVGDIEGLYGDLII